MVKQKKIKKPRSIQGYRLDNVYRNVKVKSLSDPSRTVTHQEFMGLGVCGPNVEEHDPYRLIRLGKFFHEAGEFLLKLKHLERRKQKK